jgi:hypothetical protein
MAAIVSATLPAGCYATLYDLLTGSSGLTDPGTRGLARNKWILSSFPDETGSDFPGYSIVTIESDFNDKAETLGHNARHANITFKFTIFSKKAEYIDTLAGDLRNVIVSNQSTTEGDGLFKPKITNTDTTTIFRDKDKIHVKTLFVTYEWCG